MTTDSFRAPSPASATEQEAAGAPTEAELESEQVRIIDQVIQAAADNKRPFRPVTVLIDGPSGAGKTWFAARLSEYSGWDAVHLDEFYPGWYGLAQGSEMVHEQVLRSMNPGYWRWDWAANAPGDWSSLDARDDLIVEGVGALTEENLAAAQQRGTVVSVFITGPREVRKARALNRDPEYAEWFVAWEKQEAEHFEKQQEQGLEPDFTWDWSRSQSAEQQPESA